jgi:hypothetical protein
MIRGLYIHVHDARRILCVTGYLTYAPDSRQCKVTSLVARLRQGMQLDGMLLMDPLVHDAWYCKFQESAIPTDPEYLHVVSRDTNPVLKMTKLYSY